MPHTLVSARPGTDATNIILVLYGGTITASISVTELAPHIGLLVNTYYADYQMYMNGANRLNNIADYTANYSAPWYFDTDIVNHGTRTQLAEISKLSTLWGAYIIDKKNAGKHSAWPKNCRSFVAYVLLYILRVPNLKVVGLPGLGTEVSDKSKLGLLEAFVAELRA